ncbi:MAG: arginine--tRNA ligase [Candidatus Andersenbacteria bacterium]
MINLKTTLAQDVTEGLQAAMAAGDLPEVDEMPTVVVSHSDRAGQGDYASPIALSLTKLAKKPPLEIVEAIAKHMPKKEYIGAIEAAAPGFLNVWISEAWLSARVDNIATEHLCDDIEVGAGRMVNLEFISANPTGPLTLGNARTAFSVDTLGNVMQCAGFNVIREYYFNDAGGQIRRLGESVLRRILQEQGETIEFPEELYQGEYIKDLGDTITEEWKENEGKTFSVQDLEDDAVLGHVSHRAMTKMLERIKRTITDDLHIQFDIWTSEQQIRDSGAIDEALEKLDGAGKTYEKDGALWFKTTDYGEEKDKVLVKKDGEYAYIMPDIGYHQDKFNRKYDHIFTFIGADHQAQMPKVKAAMEALGNDVSKLHFVVAQWMALKKDGKEFKPSKRKGHVYGPQDLIKEIGYDAARYFMVQHSLSSHMELDLDLAKERSERNPVYYVQYAYVRLQSILRKAKEQGLINDIDGTVPLAQQVVLTEPAEFALLRIMYRLPEVVVDITASFEVQPLAYYSHDLARAVHAFYGEVPVMAAQDPTVIKNRLQLVFAARNVLRQTLDLLGISKPEVM